MITITIETDEITDAAYNNLSTENKERINDDVQFVVKEAIYSVRMQKLKKLRADIAKDASCKDLNPEILTELLREDD